jgi:nondiscriminating glutamyl-tRNA synthetase
VFQGKDIGDFVIVKGDGVPTYHLAVVVDDITMGVTHVIRGEDHFSNTPKHVLLYNAFDALPPLYAHLPLIMNKNGKKMSKRDTDIGLTLIHQFHEA